MDSRIAVDGFTVVVCSMDEAVHAPNVDNTFCGKCWLAVL